MKNKLKKDPALIVVGVLESIIYPLIATAILLSLPNLSLADHLPSSAIPSLLLLAFVILFLTNRCRQAFEYALSNLEDREMALLLNIRDKLSKGEMVTQEMISNSIEESAKVDKFYSGIYGKERILVCAAKEVKLNKKM